MEFSVLMSVYAKETPEFLNRAFKSIWDEQNVKPSQIVLVKDGLLPDALDDAVSCWQQKLGDVLTVVALEKNVGLGLALNKGLEYCDFEIVARMDTDDISIPERFERQLLFLDKNIDISVVGGYISEFEGDEDNIYAYRKLPLENMEIRAFGIRRNPVNHVTVMFRKADVLRVGGYMSFLGFEDYYLWARMLVNGFKFANIPEVLVNVRAGAAMSGRRGGLKYASIEYKLQKEFLRLGFIGKLDFIINVVARFIARAIPNSVRIALYQKVLRKGT